MFLLSSGFRRTVLNTRVLFENRRGGGKVYKRILTESDEEKNYMDFQFKKTVDATTKLSRGNSNFFSIEVRC